MNVEKAYVMHVVIFVEKNIKSVIIVILVSHIKSLLYDLFR